MLINISDFVMTIKLKYLTGTNILQIVFDVITHSIVA